MRSISSSVDPKINHSHNEKQQQQTRPMSQASTSRIDLAGKYTRRLILSEVSNIIN